MQHHPGHPGMRPPAAALVSTSKTSRKLVFFRKLANCAAVDTELRVGDELIEVWLDGLPELMKDRIILIIETWNLLKWPLPRGGGTLK